MKGYGTAEELLPARKILRFNILTCINFSICLTVTIKTVESNCSFTGFCFKRLRIFIHVSRVAILPHSLSIIRYHRSLLTREAFRTHYGTSGSYPKITWGDVATIRQAESSLYERTSAWWIWLRHSERPSRIESRRNGHHECDRSCTESADRRRLQTAVNNQDMSQTHCMSHAYALSKTTSYTNN